MTTETQEHQPTVEQSLHSIALSMIEINKELKSSRRIHHDTLRFMKASARERVIIQPRKPSAWARFRRWLTVGGPRSHGLGGARP